MQLAGKTAIVTGAGRDIGAAVAIKLASEGANVAINYFSSSKGSEETVAAIEAAGGKAIAVQGDLNKKRMLMRLCQRRLRLSVVSTFW